MNNCWLIALVLIAASCAAGGPTPTADIEYIGLLDCYSGEAVDTKGRPLSCETSAVEAVGSRLLIISDKETPEGSPSPTMWMAIPESWSEEIASDNLIHEGNAVLRTARKIEGLSSSAEGDFVFATTDFDWPPDENSTEADPYNTLIYWPTDDITGARIAHPTIHNGVTSSLSLRSHFAEALKSAKYPEGPPYFKIEGLAALPNRELLFGIREIGVDYEHPEFTFVVLKASYTVSKDREVQLSFPLSVFANVDDFGNLPNKNEIGLSSIAAHNGRLWYLTSREAPEGEVGHESYLWTSGVQSGDVPELVMRPDGAPFLLSCKAEGLTILPDSKLFIVCDEDRSPSSFELPSGKNVTRRPGQGVYFVVDTIGG